MKTIAHLLTVACSRRAGRTAVALSVVALWAAPLAAGDGPLKVSFDDGGLAGLRYKGEKMLTQSGVNLVRIHTTDTYRNPNDEIDPTTIGETEPGNPYIDQRKFEKGDAEPNSTSFAPDRRKLTQQYDWGTLSVRYAPAGDRLDMTVTIHNRSDRVIERTALDLLRFDPPGEKVTSAPAPRAGWWSRDRANIGAPTILRGPFDGGQAVLVAPAPDRPLSYNLLLVNRDTRFSVRVVTGSLPGKKRREPYDAVFNVRPIKPGETDTYTLSLRFAGAEADPLDMASDALDHYRRKNPSLLDWPDRRPIGTMHLAGRNTGKNNPRGWRHGINPPKGWSIHDEDAKETFRRAALESARHDADQMARAGYQGMIVWTPAGRQFNSAAFYGEPRLVERIAPEMEPVIDDYFRIFREHGLRIGVIVRPVIHAPHDKEGNRVTWENIEKLYKTGWTRKGYGGVYADGHDVPFSQAEARSVLARLDAKISYAKKRWDATLFYVDWNAFWRPRDQSGEKLKRWKGRLISARLFRKLATMHPDVLIVPEHEYLGYWSAGAPYLHPPSGGKWTHDEVRRVYPDAFSILRLPVRWSDLQEKEHTAGYLDAMRRGDVLMSHAWFKTNLAADLMERIHRDAPYRLRLRPDGPAALRGKGLDEPVELSGGPDQWHKPLAKHLPTDRPAAKRRVVIVFEEEADPMAVRRAAEAVGRAGAIVAWSRPASRGENGSD